MVRKKLLERLWRCQIKRIGEVYDKNLGKTRNTRIYKYSRFSDPLHICNTRLKKENRKFVTGSFTKRRKSLKGETILSKGIVRLRTVLSPGKIGRKKGRAIQYTGVQGYHVEGWDLGKNP